MLPVRDDAQGLVKQGGALVRSGEAPRGGRCPHRWADGAAWLRVGKCTLGCLDSGDVKASTRCDS
jgi:hypothetical protein